MRKNKCFYTLLWILLLITAFSCKKGEQKLSFEQIDKAFIEKQSSNITTNLPLFYDSNEPKAISFKIGSVILFKTQEGNYGKMLVKDVYLTTVGNYSALDLAFVTYNPDGSVLAESSGLTLVRDGTNDYLDLDKGTISDQGYELKWSTGFFSVNEPTTYCVYSL